MVRRIIQILLALLFVVLVIEIVVIAPKRLGHDPDVITHADSIETLDTQEKTRVEQQMKGLHLVETSDGQKEWQLKAARAFTAKIKGDWTMEKVNVIFYAKDGVSFTVDGDRGFVEVDTKNMRIEGNVRTLSSNGYRFKTDIMIYNSLNRELRAPNKIEMFGPEAKDEKMWLTGSGMLARLKEATIQVQKNVQCEKSIRDGKQLKIRSQKADFSGKSNFARFSGDVVMDVETLRITGPQALFRYEPGSNMLRAVEVEGGVRVSDIDKFATSDRLSVDFKDDKFIFRGRPRVVQNQDELFGDQIVFLDGGKRVKVMGARAKVEKQSLEQAN
jgi:LPS export ABC transporter protein LptC